MKLWRTRVRRASRAKAATAARAARAVVRVVTVAAAAKAVVRAVTVAIVVRAAKVVIVVRAAKAVTVAPVAKVSAKKVRRPNSPPPSSSATTTDPLVQAHIGKAPQRCGAFLLGVGAVKTRLSVCARKARFASREDALRIAAAADVPLRPYRCDRCRHVHLTSRTRGKRTPRPERSG